MFSVSVRRLSGAIVVMVLALFSARADAQGWSCNVSGLAPASSGVCNGEGGFSSVAEVIAAGVARCSGPPNNGNGAQCAVEGVTYSTLVSPARRRMEAQLGWFASAKITGVALLPMTCTAPEEPALDENGEPMCIEPTSCDGSITGESLWRPAYSAGPDGSFCHELSGCRVEAANRTELTATAALVRYVGTSAGCTSEPPAPPLSTATQCISQGGNQWCTEPNLADENCGYFNQQFVCLEAIPPGNCTFMGDGSMACASDATSPPAPDDGVTPGDKATPNAGIASSDGTTTNDIDIFNSSTVNNSLGGASGNHPGSGSGPGQGGDGPGDINVEIDFDPIIEEGTDPTGPDDIDQNVAGLDTLFDEIELEMGEGDSFAQPTVGLDDSIANVLTGSTCADIVIPSSQYMPAVTFPCSELSDLRAVLGWVLRIVLAMQFFNMITTRPGS